MSNKANSSTQKSYYLPGDPSRTPLTHEEFCDIMRPFWKQRKRLQRAGECNAPARHVCILNVVKYTLEIRLQRSQLIISKSTKKVQLPLLEEFLLQHWKLLFTA